MNVRTNLDAAKRMARILGTTVARCEDMLRAGNEAGISTVYMLASIQAYAKPKTRRKARAFFVEIASQ